MIVKFYIKADKGLQIYFPYRNDKGGWFKLIDFQIGWFQYSSTHEGLAVHLTLCRFVQEGSVKNYWWLYKKRINAQIT